MEAGRGASRAGVRLPIRGRQALFVLGLALLFLYRLGFGLSSEFWYEDERQVYLLGLKFYTTGLWPYFGPDLVLRDFTRTFQIPGALQALLVGLPFYVLPVPEAPYLLLNLLSFAALGLLAWYGTLRVPELPRWLVWSLTLSLPWTLHYSTHVVNPSYVLAGSVVFFVGALETIVFRDSAALPRRWVWFMMGFALLWVAQLHLSFVLLLPFCVFALLLELRERGRGALVSLGWFAVGAAVTGSLLVPTFLRYGLLGGFGETQTAVHFNLDNARALPATAAKILSFASYEVPRFIGLNTRARLAFLASHPLIAPFGVLIAGMGVLQVVVMVALWFARRERTPGWKRMKRFMLATVLVTYASFLLTVRQPWALTFYATFPVAMVYSLFCYARFLRGRAWSVFAGVVIAFGLVFHAGLALLSLERKSLYRDRALVARALVEKDYRLLGQRREWSLY